jgi:ThiF family
MIIPDLLGDRVSSISLDPAQVQRYARHLIMPEVAMEGQKRLKAAKVLCIGTGGLGSPLSFYLAAAGVGTLGLADFDVVDVSNLQRQIIHFTSDVGRPKIDSAREKLEALNPDLNIVTHEHTIDSSNALELFAGYDVIVDGTDNSVPGERRVRFAGKAKRLWLDLPVRRSGDGFLPASRALLPLSLSRAAAAGPGTELCRRGGAGNLAGFDRRRAGDRDGEADLARRPAPGRPIVAL